MQIPNISISDHDCIPIDKFREMDYTAVEQYNIPIELMMENAGLQLARLVAHSIPNGGNILIGTGTGNNGGGGLVSARRLAGWGYRVYLDIPDEKLRELPRFQLERALAFGAVIDSIAAPDIFVDAYLRFSQRLPLNQTFKETIQKANQFKCTKISLDLPTGFNKITGSSEFVPDYILTLAAMKIELNKLLHNTDIFIADLGLPEKLYMGLGIKQPLGFNISGIVKILPKQ